MMLYVLITAVLLASGLTMALLTMFYRSPRSDARKLRTPKPRPQDDAKFRRNAVLNSALSTALVYGLTWMLAPYIYDRGAAPLWRILVEGAAILLLYDFFYYLLHRYVFHEWKLLRHVHAVHHVVKAPSAVDSLYQHPLENALGVALLWGCTALIAVVVGPVTVPSFIWAFAAFSQLNVVIHSGLTLPAFPFAPINYLTARHQRHHVGMKAQNFASVTPVFDLLFRTEMKKTSDSA